jgi:polysaccharide biosynthesis transport protein
MNLPDRYLGGELALQQQPASLTLPVNASGPDRLDLRLLLSIFQRRRRLFFGIVLTTIVLAMLVTIKQPKRYQAIADVVINKDLREIVPDSRVEPDQGPQRSEAIETELKIIKSQDMAAQVISDLRLNRDANFVRSVTGGTSILGKFRSFVGITAPSLPERDLERRLTDALLGDLKAERMETAYAIRLTYTTDSPKRAAMIANSFARIYASKGLGEKRAENEKTLTLLKTRIEELRVQAQTDFKAVQDFRVRNNLLSAQATQLSEQDAAAYSQQLAAARAEAAGSRGRLNAARGAGTEEALSSPVIQSLRSQRAVISVKATQLSGRYLESHPELITARRELADLDLQINAEIGRVMSGLASSSDASAQRVGSLQGNLGAARSTLASNNQALVGLDDLSRRAQSSQGLYESYLNRYKEVLASSGTERADAHLISAAKVPSVPVSPNMPLNLLLGLVIGTLVGAGAAIITETAFAGLTTGEEVENRLGARFVGGVPLLSSIDAQGIDPLSSISLSPNSGFAEAIRGLMASARISSGSRNQVIAITSALPGEGKTTLAACIARSAAMAGESVIVIDCDVMRRNLSHLFNADGNKPGLREMIHGTVKLGEVMFKDSESSAMILPITTLFDPGERLLEKGNFHKMIAILREHFSLILLDTAPILPVAETREIVALADNVMVTTRWRKTADTAIRSALKLLPSAAIVNVGIVLNRIDMKKQVRFGMGDASSYYDSYKQYYTQS